MEDKELINKIDEIAKRWDTLKDIPEQMQKLKPGELPKQLDDIAKGLQDVQKDLTTFKKEKLKTINEKKENFRKGQYVTDECAKFLGSMLVVEAERTGKLKGNQDREALCRIACDVMGIEQRSTLTSSDIPLPTDFSGQVVELVWQYGQARQFGTVYPLGALTTKLPKLSTSPAFGLVAIATAVGEKSPQAAWVTFTAEKWGGLIRWPSEIDADSIIPLGNFLARYIAREMAKIEDTVFWVADGTATYDSLSGLLLQAYGVGSSRYILLGAGKTATADITLSNLRSLRSKVSSAALKNSAYYMNISMESLLSTFNTSATVTPYQANGLMGPTLDGFPIRWVDVLPINDTAANASALAVGFGDASYHYLGMRSGIDIQQSKDVYFSTDEVALRALERFTTGLMSNDAFAALRLAAA